MIDSHCHIKKYKSLVDVQDLLFEDYCDWFAFEEVSQEKSLKRWCTSVTNFSDQNPITNTHITKTTSYLLLMFCFCDE